MRSVKYLQVLGTRRAQYLSLLALAAAACTSSASQSSHAQMSAGAADEPATARQEAPAGALVEGQTEAIAAVAGRFSTRAPAQESMRFYATDLGWAFSHRNELWLMFGDSWLDERAIAPRNDADDVLGKVSLSDFPDGDAVERWLRAHPAPAGRPRWHAAAPTLHYVTDSALRVTPLRPVRNGLPLSLGPALTPVAGFSNARTDDAAAAFGIFLRNEPVQCSARGACAEGYDCDAQLGRCAPVSDISIACVVGGKDNEGCRCVAVGNRKGLCIDPNSSLYDPSTERGRANAVVMRQQVGNALRNAEATFASQPWDTHRFFNATARTVRSFDPRRPKGAGNDYRAADGRAPEGEGVFVWGRPNFGGIGAKGRDAQLYLAWVPMPSYSAAGMFAWQPRYFAGLTPEGVPLFTSVEADGVPLDLDANTPGEQPGERHDIVGQMSISWIPSQKRFVMLYGGDLSPAFLKLIFGTDMSSVKHDPLGSIFVRYAEHPWGPWTPPRAVLHAGDPIAGPAAQYGPGGIMHHPSCKGATCAPTEPAFASRPNEHGRLYAPSIIEPWTEERAEGAVDLYWNVSTWNPYQVVLMKTRLTLTDTSGW